MKSAAEIQAALAQFTGTENYHYNAIARASGVVYTEGIRTLAMDAECWWLLDAICSHQPRCRRDPLLKQIQFWTLTVKDNAAVLICERDEGDIAIRQDIPATDFPLPEMKIWIENGSIDGINPVMVMMLPTER